MRQRPALATGGALLATALVAPAAAAAPLRATVLACGTVLTSSVRLAADVACPRGGAIVLAADGVELNLNGHALTGPGKGTASVGVVVTARGVVVRGGRVAGWGTGVAAGTDGDDLEAPATLTATVRDARLEGNGYGVHVATGAAVTVRHSRLSGNDRGGAASFGGRLRVEDSTAERNGTGFSSFAVPVDGLVVRDSLVRRNRDAGVSCSQDGHYDVTGSTLQSNGVGLDLFECGGRVEGSAFVWNRRHVAGYLAERDPIILRCNTYTRDGGPVEFPVLPCGAGS